jgi:hypothetical protein
MPTALISLQRWGYRICLESRKTCKIKYNSFGKRFVNSWDRCCANESHRLFKHWFTNLNKRYLWKKLLLFLHFLF